VNTGEIGHKELLNFFPTSASGSWDETTIAKNLPARPCERHGEIRGAKERVQQGRGGDGSTHKQTREGERDIGKKNSHL